MKKFIFFVFLLFITQFVHSQQISTDQNNLSEEVTNATDKIAKIQYWHKQIFSLPFEREFITGTIMEEVKLKRNEVSPHFPSRAQTGDDSESVNNAFVYWIESYPNEYALYIEAVSIILRKYK